MKAATRFLALTTLTVASLTGATSAWAVLQPVDEETMSNAYAGDGTDKLTTPNSTFLNFANFLMQEVSSKSVKVLSRDEFVATMAASGVTLSAAVYDGRAVTEVTLPSHPVTSTFKVSDLISSMTGVKYNAPGMGNITVQNFDAGGTRLWVWNH